MIKFRDHLSDLRWRLANGRVHLSNAWYRAAGRRIHGTRQQYRNWLNRRAVTRGRSPLPERLTRPVRSSLPVYRNRVNPATGRPHRDDAPLGRMRDRDLATRKADREATFKRLRALSSRDPWESGPDACRPAPRERAMPGRRSR